MTLPVESLLAPLCDALNTHDVLLSAPPGAGKSTAIPLALLARSKQRIVMLQPRRVVVKQLAAFLAEQLGESVGQTVGYRIKGEQAVSQNTRLEIITEGILSRRIQQDPELDGVDIILFDEFHERNLHSDFGLALAIEVKQALRDDLRLLVMSATLDVSPIQALLPEAEVLHSDGRQFPVEVNYLGECQHHELVNSLAKHVRVITAREPGDILVFLPTVKHILQLQQQLNASLSDNVDVMLLYGNLPLAEQQRALRPLEQGRRKIILATNIAETSLTIEGISVVIDSGRELVAEYHPKSQMTELSLQMISQASAEQRKGRAGRLAAGKCYRLWSEDVQGRLRKYSQPDIHTQDITGLVLQSAAWGTPVSELALLDMPSAAQLQSAVHTLVQLGAFSKQGDITSLGRQAAQLPVQPRTASMLLKVKALTDETGDSDWLVAGGVIAALSEDPPKYSGWDVHLCLKQLQGQARQRVTEQAQRLVNLLRGKVDKSSFFKVDETKLAVAIGLLNPDWLACKQSNGTFKLAQGVGAELSADAYFNGDWLAVLSGQRRGASMQIRLAQPIDIAVLKTHFANGFSEKEALFYDATADSLRAESQQCFGEIVLSRQPLAKAGVSSRGDFWREWLSGKPLKDWPNNAVLMPTIHRLCMARTLNLEYKHYGETHTWPEPTVGWILACEAVHRALQHCQSVAQLKQLPWDKLLFQSMPWPLQEALNSQLPDAITVPSGTRRALRYDSQTRVVLSVKMQEVYGSSEPVCIANGRQTVTVELLSPANRPIQTTDDLPGFWKGSYVEVRKEMKGRYPKHIWPEDPTTAQATIRTTKPK